jgi:hypothetical protein
MSAAMGKALFSSARFKTGYYLQVQQLAVDRVNSIEESSRDWQLPDVKCVCIIRRRWP